MKTSVIIPTISRPESLKNLLRSLARGTVLPDEVIVVDQGDTAKTQRNVEDENFPFSVFIFAQEEESPAIARNRGVQESSGDLLFFFDDDVEVDPTYIETAKIYLLENKRKFGVTGRFIDEKQVTFWRIWAAVFFNIYSWRSRNRVLPSGSYDFIRGRHAKKEQPVEWMRGGNMVFRRSIFEEGFRFYPNFKKWAFGEDVMLTYQIYRKHPDSLWYLPNLGVRHHGGQKSRMSHSQILKMQIIYRYIFWKQEVWRNKGWKSLAYIWAQFGLSLLHVMESPSLETLHILVRSYGYLLKKRKNLLKDPVAYNAFIFSDETPLKKKMVWWKTSIFGVFPFIRFRQMIDYPPFSFHYFRRILYYNFISDRYIPKYREFIFLSPQETLRRLIDRRMSLARFGDGEMEQMTGAGMYPPDSDWSQRTSADLRRRIKQVLSSQMDNLLIATVSPEIFLGRKKDTKSAGILHSMWIETRRLLWRYLHKNRQYGDANVFIPAHHPDFDWKKLKAFLRDRVVLIITGDIDALSDISLGKRTLFVEAGKHDAFKRYEAIVAEIRRCIKMNDLRREEVLIMVSLGPTADLLAYDFSKNGYQVWDTGHLFKYAWQQLKELGQNE